MRRISPDCLLCTHDHSTTVDNSQLATWLTVMSVAKGLNLSRLFSYDLSDVMIFPSWFGKNRESIKLHNLSLKNWNTAFKIIALICFHLTTCILEWCSSNWLLTIAMRYICEYWKCCIDPITPNYFNLLYIDVSYISFIIVSVFHLLQLSL